MLIHLKSSSTTASENQSLHFTAINERILKYKWFMGRSVCAEPYAVNKQFSRERIQRSIMMTLFISII